MKKIYLKPEIEEVTIYVQQLLAGSVRMTFRKTEEEEDEEVDDFDLLL